MVIWTEMVWSGTANWGSVERVTLADEPVTRATAVLTESQEPIPSSVRVHGVHYMSQCFQGHIVALLTGKYGVTTRA